MCEDATMAMPTVMRLIVADGRPIARRPIDDQRSRDALVSSDASDVAGSRPITDELGHVGPLEDPDRIAADIVSSMLATSA